MTALGTEVSAILRELTTQRGIGKQLADEDPLMEIITKEEIEGNPVVNIQVSRGAGGSAVAATAAANSQLAERAKLTLDAGDYYRVVSLVDKDMMAARGSGSGSLVSHIEDQLAEADSEAVDQCIMELYGSGDGVLGQLDGSALSGSSVTLTSASDVRKIQKGMRLVFSASRTGALRDSGDTLTVLSTDPLSKTVTFSSVVSGISGLGVSDFCFIEGNAAAGGAIKLSTGFDGWIRATSEDGGAFFGYTRTNAPQALIAGTVSDQSAGKGDTYTKTSDGLADIVSNSNLRLAKSKAMMNVKDWIKLSRDLTSVGIQGDMKESVAGHEHIKVLLGALNTTICPSHYVPEGRVLVGEFEDPKNCKILHYKSELIGYLQAGEGSGKSGTVFNRNLNLHEAMLARYSQLAVYKPSKFGWINL